MNAMAHTFETEDTVSGQRIVAFAKDFTGRAYASSPRRENCFDCVAFIEQLAAAAGQSAEISARWMDDGGELPFARIALEDATPGDIIVFDMSPVWKHRPFHMALLTHGLSVDDRNAKVFGPYTARAACSTWLAPWFRKYAVAAYRFDKREA